MRKEKRLLVVIIILTVLFCQNSCRTKKQNGDLSLTQATTIIVRNSLCDSVYSNFFVDYNNRQDTLIKGIKYVYTLSLSEKYILAFRGYNEEYGLKSIVLLIEGFPLELFSYTDDEDVYYDELLPSPSNKYVFFCQYYATLDMGLLIREGIEEEILRFGGGYILDLERQETHYLSPSEVSGNWNYCDQWIEQGQVIYDPNDED